MSANLESVTQSLATGVYPDLSNEDYHRGPGVSSTVLKDMLRSPLHCWSRHVDPERPAAAPTAPMVLGSAVHTATLEPTLWETEYAVAPRCDRRTKAGKEIWKAFQEEAAGRIALPAEQGELAIRVADATLAHPAAALLLETGAAEQSVYFDHPLGELVKVRPDWWASQQWLCDLKTTGDASPKGFARQVAQLNYHLQAAFYVDVVEAVTGECLPWYWIAVETQAPYAVAVYRASPELLEAGRQLYLQALALYTACRQTGSWPGYSVEPQVLELPPWALKDHGEEALEEVAL